MKGLARWLLGDTRDVVGGQYIGDRVPSSRCGTRALPPFTKPSVEMEAIQSPSGTIQACYAYLDPKRTVARTVEVSPSVMVDVDAEGRPVGVETLDGSDWASALATLAFRGRVRII